METSLRVVVCTFRICRHYLLRIEAILALFMLFTMWYYLKWMDGRLRQKISLAAVTLNRSFMETQKLYAVRNWFELGFHSLHDSGRQTWKYEKGPVALYAVKGRRDSMEDRFSIVTEQSRWGLNLFGIFDGHGGKFAADFVEKTLFKSVMQRVNSYDSDGKGPNLTEILIDEIISVDEKLVNITEEAKDVTGTTALVAMIHKGILTVANVGDSRGIMCLANGKHMPISFDHKPNNLKEKERIRKAGGWVAFNGVWRVAGVLATSRALGDYFLKRPRFVIPDPDILTFDLNQMKPKFIILATDGLWDTVPNEMAADFILRRLDEPLFGAKALAEFAISRGSLDNVSVMIVRLESFTQPSDDNSRLINNNEKTDELGR